MTCSTEEKMMFRPALFAVLVVLGATLAESYVIDSSIENPQERSLRDDVSFIIQKNMIL